MNEAFAQYTTSVAFSLQLTKLQCHLILTLGSERYTDWQRASFMTTLHSLERKGIVYWERLPDGSGNGFKGLTEAGKLLVQLLQAAGLTVENTQTAHSLRVASYRIAA